MLFPPKRNAQATCVCLAAALFLLATTSSASAASLYVSAGGDLQAALNAAQPGDVVLLQAGAVFRGKYTLPRKNNPAGLFITVRSAAADSVLPAPGTRIDPAYAVHLPKLKSSDTLPVLTVPPGASYWRVQFIEFQANVSGSSDIIRVGTHLETIAANQPHHIVFDRVYVHGDAAIGQKNAVVAHASDFELRNSYISDIKQVGTETHAFVSYNGAGPYIIENNYLEAAGVNVLIGGADPTNGTMTPSRITFRRNHVAKNVAWMTPRADGRYWTVKNLFELKAGRYVTVTGNLFENNWNGAGDQPGYAVLLRTENQSGSCDWCETGHVLFEHNIIRHTPAGLSLLGLDYPSGGTPRGVRMHDVTFRNNLFDDIDIHRWVVGTTITTAKFAQINGVDRLTLDHNTVIMPSQTGLVFFVGSYDSPEFVYTNNMSAHKSYGIKGEGTGMGKATLDAFTLNSQVTANVIAGASTTVANGYPTGNHFPAVTTWQAEFADYAGGDYRLRSTSAYAFAGVDGRPLGADIGAIAAAIGGSQRANQLPVAHDQVVSATEDHAVGMLLTGSDPDGDVLTFAVASAPAQGVLTGQGASLTYTPRADYRGSDSFSFEVSDGKGGTARGTVSLAVAAVNDAPTAYSQAVSTAANTPVQIPLRATDVDGDLLTWSVTVPVSGTLSGIAPALTYTPGTNFAGTDTFTVTASDGQLSSTAVVTINVTRLAVAVTTTTLTQGKVGKRYAQDLQATGGTMPYAWSLAGGALPPGMALESGTITGTPTTAGTYAFVVRVTDAAGTSATHTLSIKVVSARK